MRLRTLGPVAIAAALVSSAAYAAPAARPDEASCASLERGDRAARVTWGTPERTSGCFFFSGPGELGRDDHLGASARFAWSGERVTLAFGAHRFTGRERGESVALTRRSEHDYGGRWTVTEHIEGRFERVRRGESQCRVLRARYRYTECEAGGACPGRCTITAFLLIAAAP